MFFLASLFLGIAFAQVVCRDIENNPTSKLNPVCSNAGTCVEGGCFCCRLDEATLKPETFSGEPDCPNWTEGYYVTNSAYSPDQECNQLEQYPGSYMSFYFPPGAQGTPTVACNPQTVERIRDLFEQYYNDHDYPGRIVLHDSGCTLCTPSQPCEFCDQTRSNNCRTHDTGVKVDFGTDFNTYYDLNCYDDSNLIPTFFNDEKCDANKDYSYTAKVAFGRVKKYNEAAPDLWNSDWKSDFKWVNEQLTGSETTGMTESFYQPIINEVNMSDRVVDQCMLRGYTNDVSDLEYIGDFTGGCKGGISDSWTGGKTCASPYIVCLPEENTPNQDPKWPFFPTTDHKYTVEQCKFECAFDQRCRGFQFEAVEGHKGDCTLLDDIQLQGEGTNTGYVYDDTDDDLMGKKLCFAKGGDSATYCNPFFEASELNEEMLNCYCPNNRKGFYTKKVKRIVENTKFCEREHRNVDEIDLRIQQAQANRMFHLCENWCLFNTFDPMGESWYYNPWLACWREQYAGVGEHMSYCNRVIRDPETIEQQYITDRTARFCADDGFTQIPTPQPSEYATLWFMADEAESCDDACFVASESKCDEVKTASLDSSKIGTSEPIDAFNEAGITTCASFAEGPKDWALPGMKMDDNVCYLRNDETGPDTGCNWAIGEGYQRICACTVTGCDNPGYKVFLTLSDQTCDTGPGVWYKNGCDGETDPCSGSKCRALCDAEPRCNYFFRGQSECHMFSKCEGRQTMTATARTFQKQCALNGQVFSETDALITEDLDTYCCASSD